MKWDKLEGIVNRVAIKNRVNPEVVKAIIEHIFISIKKSFRDSSLPRIQISNFGTFKVNSGTIRRKLILLQELYDSGKIDFFVYRDMMIFYINVYERLVNEEDINERL